MKHGFISVAAATPKIKVADPAYNAAQIITLIKEADEKNIKMIVLPELCVSAYTCGDLFMNQTLLASAENALLAVAEATENMNILAVVGVPLRHLGKLFNCAAVISKGMILGVVPKSSIPNYGEFYEYRYFSPAPEGNSHIKIGEIICPFGTKLIFECRQANDFCAAVEICEDTWFMQNTSRSHAAAGAAIIAGLSASIESIGKDEQRRRTVKGKSSQLICGYIYSNSGEGESSTDLVFSAHNIIGERGTVIAEAAPFSGSGVITSTEIDVERVMSERKRITTYPAQNKEGYQTIYFDTDMTETKLTRKISARPFIPSDKDGITERCLRILEIQSRALVQRICRSFDEGAVIAVSGGLDSCLALLVTVRAMDILNRSRKNITAISMPCFGTTQRTKNNAEILCRELGVTFKTIDITEAVKVHFRDIGHDEGNFNSVFENAQARERTQVVMDTANAAKSLAIGTGDLSELAVGWTTYNGDHMSMYGVNASVPKTLVKHIVNYSADEYEAKGEANLAAVLRDILATPVSPELLPSADGEISQKTEDIVGPYDLHDFFLYHTVRFGSSPEKIYRMARHAFKDEPEYPPDIILKWLKIFTKRFFSQQFKRSCMPDGPKIGSVDLSPRGGWRMPSDASSDVWMTEIENIFASNTKNSILTIDNIN